MRLILLLTLLSFNLYLAAKLYTTTSTNFKLRFLESDSTELVVVFENYNSKFYTEIISKVEHIAGLSVKGYCETLKCFYFQVDPLVFKTESEAFQALESKTRNFLPVHKDGTTVAMVISNCPRN